MSLKHYNHPIIKAIRLQDKSYIDFFMTEPLQQEILDECLVYASVFESETACFEFINLGANFTHNNYESVRGAVASGHLKLLKYFISKGADPLLRDDSHIGYYTSDAAYWGRLNTLHYLIEELGVPYRNDNDNPFRYASYNGHLDCVKYLYNKGVDINAEDGFAIVRACEKNQIDVIEFLIEKNIEIEKFKYQVIQNICKNGTLPTLNIIFKRNIKFDFNKDVMVCAILNPNTEILEFALSCGADIHISNDYLIQTANKDNRFELIDMALNRGVTVEYIQEKTSAITHSYLLQKKLAETMSPKNNKYPLIKI